MALKRVSDTLMGYAHGTLLGTDPGHPFAVPAGRNPPMIQRGRNDLSTGASAATAYLTYPFTPGTASAYWKDPFAPNQYSEIGHDPGIINHLGDALFVGPTVRQSATEDSCYAAYVVYVRESHTPPTTGTTDDMVKYWCRVVLVVDRVNAGVATNIATVTIPGWTFPDDWWFYQLQVWGQNPVHLRVLTKAPLSYVPGSTYWRDGIDQFLPCTAMYDLPAPYGATYLTGTMDWIDGWPDSHVAPENSAAVVPGSESDPVTGKAAPGRAWIVWEGQDASASRLTRGQPGFRWGTNNWGQWNAVKFTAGELDPTLDVAADPPVGGSVRLSGGRIPGSTVTVTRG